MSIPTHEGNCERVVQSVTNQIFGCCLEKGVEHTASTGLVLLMDHRNRYVRGTCRSYLLCKGVAVGEGELVQVQQKVRRSRRPLRVAHRQPFTPIALRPSAQINGFGQSGGQCVAQAPAKRLSGLKLKCARRTYISKSQLKLLRCI
eukprot:249130-Prymnesium_polylepis.1